MIRLEYPASVPFRLWQATLVACGISLLLILQQYIQHLSSGHDYAFSWDIVVLRTFLEYGCWLIAIPLLAKVLFPVLIGQKIGLPFFIKAVAIGLLLTLGHRLLIIVLFDSIYFLFQGGQLQLFRGQNITAFWAGLFSSLIQLIAISTTILGIAYYQRYLGQQKALAEAELRALKMQIQPHFLFNTFHSIAALIDIQPESAQLMLSRLSYLLRTILEKEKEQKISLQEEMEFIQHYLSIEEVRFQDRLSLVYNIQPDTLKAQVPTFLLQPIVENALKHGIAQMTAGGVLTVGAKRIGLHQLRIWVEDNGPGISQTKQGFGLGLENIQQRLFQLYGSDFYFEALPQAEGGFKVSILLPWESKSESFHVYSHADH